MMTESRRRSRAHFDWPLVLAVYGMAIFGIICIASARMDPDNGTNLSLLGYILGNSSSTWQSIFVLVSPVVLVVVMAVPMELYRNRIGDLIYFGVLFLLAITLILSTAINGINAWLDTGLGRMVQPAEFAKISVMIALARQLSRSKKPMGTFKDFFRVCMTVGVPAVIVLLQGETGSVIVIGVTFLAMVYFSGADLRILGAMVGTLVLGVAFLITYALITGSTDYRLTRILAFIDPQSYSQSGGYQVLGSQIAIGSGQITGLGPFKMGTHTQLGNVPESSTDFILATIGEAFGFVGVMAVILTYLFIILRLLYLARFTNDKFSQLIIIGVMSMLLFHVFQNICMCLGLMPITGIPLPFLSYGGSNFITNIIGIGLVLNATRSRSAASVVMAPLPRYGEDL